MFFLSDNIRIETVSEGSWSIFSYLRGLASDCSTKPCPTTMIANIAYKTLLYYKQKTHDAS